MARRFGPGYPHFVGRRVVPLAAGAVALAAALAGPAPNPSAAQDTKSAAAQSDPTKLRVPIRTADFVDLDGTYYRGSRGRDTPCVILVHKYGSDRSKGNWDDLARLLQRDGFCVLTFDLRGHGGSTSVSPAFWKVTVNHNGIKNSSRKDATIKFEDFKPTYLPWLVNDLLAARRFLEEKNDTGELNAKSIYVVGAQEGAALGMLFVAAEWHRTYTVGFKALQSNGTPRQAGEDIAGGVWLSLPQRPNPSVTFNYRDWVRANANLREKNPMAFIYGEKDAAAKATVDDVMRVLTQAERAGREKHKLDKRIELKGTDLAGQALLGNPALGVPAQIVDYVKKVQAERKAISWSEFQTATNPLTLVPLQPFGIRAP